MYIDYENNEYKSIISDIINNREFKKLEGYKHHSTNRLEHSLRVSFYSYKICKRLGLDYVSASRGGLLHDFFLNTYKGTSKKNLLHNQNHHIHWWQKESYPGIYFVLPEANPRHLKKAYLYP